MLYFIATFLSWQLGIQIVWEKWVEGVPGVAVELREGHDYTCRGCPAEEGRITRDRSGRCSFSS
jgi:hypothetical protein